MIDWPLLLLIFFGMLVILMMSGMPVAFCFLIINIVGVMILWGGGVGIEQMINSTFDSLTKFTFLPLPMFILMGEILFLSGVATFMIDAVDKWLGKIRGRLSLIAVGSGTILATLTGVSMASVAMLGSVLVPKMEERGYKKAMTLGPILGSGGLAIMIPPSTLGVIVGAIGEISIGKILIAIIMPGLMMAGIYVAYILLRCWLQPNLAPSYYVPPVPLREKLSSFVKYIMPIAIVIFLVIGVMMLGVATPTEAAVTGVVGCLILAAIYRKLDWVMLKKAGMNTVSITVMMFTIVIGASVFAQMLAFSGGTSGLSHLASELTVAPLVIMWIMQIIVLVLGCFMDIVAILMVCLPIFMPIVHAVGLDPVWFAVIILINTEVAGISPPFGLSLFVMKGVAPKDTTMGDVYRGALPFCGLSVLSMAIITVFPAVALWLPGLMRTVGG
jgi:tripartite ATP-independent transporter DctM subunit